MIGAIAGDIIGSPYEFGPIKPNTHDFPLWNTQSRFTDDSVMSLAVADALMRSIDEGTIFDDEIISSMQAFGRRLPNAGYGGRFYDWIYADEPQPYNSWGNGSAMRVSPIGWAFGNLKDTLRYATASARVTHNHPEGIKGAQATAAAIFLARTNNSKEAIRSYLSKTFGYNLERTLDDIRPVYEPAVSCQETVPEAMIAFFESSDYEDAVRKAVSLGGDTDTLACICGSVAEAFYGVPEDIEREARSRLDDFLLDTLNRWQAWLRQRRSSCRF